MGNISCKSATMKKSLIVIFLISVGVPGYLAGQHTIESHILNEDEQAIPYVNIGILGTKTGTVSDEEGYFKLHVESPSQSDTIIISAIGFKKEHITTQEMAELNAPIVLTKVVVELGEILVTRKKLKKKKYGQLKGDKNVARATVRKRGFEDAVLIEASNYPFLVKKAAIRIGATRQKEYSLRIRFYGLDQETGFPGEELTSNNYIITSKRKKGIVSINLEEENIWFDEPVFLSVEWLMNKEDQKYTYALLDSIKSRTLKNEEMEKAISDPKERSGQVMENSMKIVEFSGLLPTTFYVISKKPNTRSFSRALFLDEWKEDETAIVAYLEVLHE